MARPRQPVKLLEFKGKKHLTKEEIRQREASEVKPVPKGIKPPAYLSESQKKLFRKLAKQLSQLEAYFRMVTEKNKVMNLTAITERGDFILLHYLDSLAPLYAGEEFRELLGVKGAEGRLSFKARVLEITAI